MQYNPRPRSPWARMVIAMSAMCLLLVGIFLVEGKANAQYPPSASSFTRHFKAGDYGHYGHHKRYSSTFKTVYLDKYMRQWKRHHHDHVRLSVAEINVIKSNQWSWFVNHDSCNSGTDLWEGTPNCAAYRMPRSYSRSIYGGYLTKDQTKWVIRILWCGGMGVAAFYTGGATEEAAAAIGPGALGCFGSFFVP